MHEIVAERAAQIAALCRQFGVVRLEVFGSASHGQGFDLTRSDVDLLVEFASPSVEYRNFLAFEEAIAALLRRRVDLVERKSVERSRNHIRRRSILADAELLYAA
jgi:predicted nucleotidyltransferase